MKFLKKTLIVVLLLLLCFSLASCANSSEEKAEVEKVVKEYLKAIENDDFAKQKDLTANGALDFTLFKELEDEIGKDLPIKTTIEIETKKLTVTKVSKSSAAVDMQALLIATNTLTETGEKVRDVRRIDGPMKLEKINDDWKIVDYLRDKKSLSESIFTVNVSQTEKDLKVEVAKVFVLPRRTLVVLRVENNGKDDVLLNARHSAVLVDEKGMQADASTEEAAKMFDTIKSGETVEGYLGFASLDTKKNKSVRLVIEGVRLEGNSEISWFYDINLDLSKNE